MSKNKFDALRIDIWISGTADRDGNGGYAALMHTSFKDKPYEVSIGGYGIGTTVTRMTLKALLEALKKIKNPSFIHFYTSLPYISAGLNRNMNIWEKNDWIRKDGKFLKHSDLWEQISELL